jgi:hypothetical protein
MLKGTMLDLDDLNKMYVLASRHVVVRAGRDSGGATFATDQSQKKPGASKNVSDKKSR